MLKDVNERNYKNRKIKQMTLYVGTDRENKIKCHEELKIVLPRD